MHELAVVGYCHMLVVDSPRHVFRQYLAVVFGIGNARTTPVLGINEVGILKSLHLIVLDAGTSSELLVEFVAVRMGDYEVDIGCCHPLGKRVGHSLGQCAAMRSPRKHYLRTCLGLVFLNGDEVGKRLKRMHGGCLHGKDGATAVLDELRNDCLGIVILAVGESGKGANTDKVAVAAHYRDSLKQMF